MQAEPSQIPDNDLLHAIARGDEVALAATYVLTNIRAASDEDRRDAKTSAQVVRLSDRSESKAWPNFLRIAASIALIALLIGIVVLWRRDLRLQREIAQLSRQLNAQQRELARDRDALAREREALAMLTSPGAKRMDLAGTTMAQNARGTFVFDQQGRA